MELNKRKIRVQSVFLNGTELVKHFKLLFASSTPKIVNEVFEMEAKNKVLCEMERIRQKRQQTNTSATNK